MEAAINEPGRVAVSLLVVAAAAAAACAPKNHWFREDTSQEQLAYDRASCERTAEGYRFLGTGGAGSMGQAALFKDCMARRGYLRGPIEEDK